MLELVLANLKVRPFRTFISIVGVEKPKGFNYWQLLKVIIVIGIFSALEYLDIFDKI